MLAANAGHLVSSDSGCCVCVGEEEEVHVVGRGVWVLFLAVVEIGRRVREKPVQHRLDDDDDDDVKCLCVVVQVVVAVNVAEACSDAGVTLGMKAACCMIV